MKKIATMYSANDFRHLEVCSWKWVFATMLTSDQEMYVIIFCLWTFRRVEKGREEIGRERGAWRWGKRSQSPHKFVGETSDPCRRNVYFVGESSVGETSCRRNVRTPSNVVYLCLSLSVSVCWSRLLILCKNGWTDQDVDCGVESSSEPKKPSMY